MMNEDSDQMENEVISLKIEPDDDEPTSSESVIDYAQKTMNSLLGMYGYEESVTAEAVKLNIQSQIRSPVNTNAIENEDSNYTGNIVSIDDSDYSLDIHSSQASTTQLDQSSSTNSYSNKNELASEKNRTVVVGSAKPSKPSTPYMRYRNKVFKEIKHKYPGCTPYDLACLISHKWSMLTDEERRVWEDQYEVDMVRYDQSVNNYLVEKQSKYESKIAAVTQSMQKRSCSWCKEFTVVRSFSSMVDNKEIYCDGLCSEKCFIAASRQVCNIENSSNSSSVERLKSVDERTMDLEASSSQVSQVNKDGSIKRIQSTLCVVSQPSNAYSSASVVDSRGESPIAPWTCFRQAQFSPSNQFIVGMKVEAQHPDYKSNHQKTTSRKSASAFCLATITAVVGGRLLLHFDGAAATIGDFWRLPDSGDIYPVGWNDSARLKAPPDYALPNTEPSTYSKYVATHLLNAEIAPARFFKKEPRLPAGNYFVDGMKLEAIIKSKPSMIAQATVGAVEADQVKIVFDGYPKMGYWCFYGDRDLFPVGWCSRNGFPLQTPGKQQQLTSSSSVVKSTLLGGSITHTGIASLSSNQQPTTVLVKQAESIFKDKGRSCVKVFVNADCFCGPYIVSRKLRNLQPFYSGNIRSVITKLLEDVIKCAFDPKTVLGFLKPGRGGFVVTAVCKGVTYQCSISNIDRVSSLWRLLEQFADNLRCCPNIFSSIEQRSQCYRCNRTQRAQGESTIQQQPAPSSPTPSSSTLNTRFTELKSLDRKRVQSCSSDDELLTEDFKRMEKRLDFQTKKRKLERTQLTIENNNASRSILNSSPVIERNNFTPDDSTIDMEHITYQAEPEKIERASKVTVSKENVAKLAKSDSIDQSLEPKVAGGKTIAEPPKTWSISKLLEFIKDTDVSQCAASLEDNEIDGKAMLLLERDLVLHHMGIKLGPALKLLDLIEELKAVQKKFTLN